ncbi:uncharacterized protein LODBEIA_P59460 [Lodderomyces beijingensis]|uniref:Uncharacterized protein n=1 Tax=Lodderomyces beijingensis TaxID=1775926 RepID=A0ABP0ZVR6_9ASCO
MSSELGQFIESFQSVIGQISTRKNRFVNKTHLGRLNSHLNELGVHTCVTVAEIGKIRTCLEELFQNINADEYYEDKLGWFLINLYLSPFIRQNFIGIVKFFWPLLFKISVCVEDAVVLHKLVDDALNNSPSVSWLSSKLLTIIVDEPYIYAVVKGVINKRENVVKFQQLIHLNRDFSTLINLIKLFVALNLESVFLPNFSTSYSRYIQSFNPNFKNLIPCAITANTANLAGPNCHIQPIERHVFNLWISDEKEKLSCHHINLAVFDSYQTFPNSEVWLHFSCSSIRQTRSSQLTMKDALKSFSAVKADGSKWLNLTLEVQVKDVVHYNWLINYLSSLRNRKISINLREEHSLQTSIPSKCKADSESLRSQMQMKQYSRKAKPKNAHSTSAAGGGSSIGDDSSSCAAAASPMQAKRARGGSPAAAVNAPNASSSFSFSLGPGSLKRKRRATSILSENDYIEGNGSSQIIIAPATRVSRVVETQQAHEYRQSSNEEVEGLPIDPPKTRKTKNLDTQVQVSAASSSSDETIEQTEKNEMSGRVVPTPNPEVPNSPEFRTSTPVEANFTALPNTTDKTSQFDTSTVSNHHDLMRESLRLFSSNLMNKLKYVEFKTLEKRNELQSEMDREFERIEAKHRAKLKEIQEFCKDELNKII